MVEMWIISISLGEYKESVRFDGHGNTLRSLFLVEDIDLGLSPPDFNCKVEGGVGGLQRTAMELDVFFMCLSMNSESSFLTSCSNIQFLELFML